MVTTLKNHSRLNETLMLGIMSVCCLGLSLFRMFLTQTSFYFFLNWNLFLAFIPWALTSLVIVKPGIQKHKGIVFLLMGVWLLFFPNAPYILTDLFHLRFNTSMPIWYDLVMILSYAWTGLLFGLFSLRDLENILSKTFPNRWLPVLIIGLLFLSGFGIYIGRFLRWNSWDIIQNPQALLFDIADRFIHPLRHPRTWGVTIFMGLFLNMIYWSLKMMRKNEA